MSQTELRRNCLSAGEFPWKLLSCRDVLVAGQLRPMHLNFSPTNRCNSNCAWCSCSGVDRKLEMPLAECRALLADFSHRGTRAVTITGGGEPTLHPELGQIVDECMRWDLRRALVTNGRRWAAEGVPDYAEHFDWIRLSVTETEKEHDVGYVETICRSLPGVPIGVTFTVGFDPNLRTATELCDLANRNPNLTHVRFIQNILAPSPHGMHQLRCALGLQEKALFQMRNVMERGQGPCYVSRLKPYIDADGSVYPCCGIQYATDELRTLPKKTRMCHWTQYADAPPFDGSQCGRCFYGRCNDALLAMVNPPAHLEFV